MPRCFYLALLALLFCNPIFTQAQPTLDPPSQLTASVSGDAVTLSWQAPGTSSRDIVDATLGAEGGSVRSMDGEVEFVMPPGALEAPSRVRLTRIPIDEFHQEVVDRGLPTIGEPVERASLIEIEAQQLRVPTQLRVTRPANLPLDAFVVFTQVLVDRLRLLGQGFFSDDGVFITMQLPINPQVGLLGSTGEVAGKRPFFLREIQGNGIDDDGDGLIDEMEILNYPDQVEQSGTCVVTGTVSFSNGTPVPGADVRVLGPNALPFIDLADEFGRYYLLLPFLTGTSVNFTVSATAPVTNQVGTASASCVPGGTVVRHVIIDTNAPPGLQVAITSPENEAQLDTNVPIVSGTVSDPTVNEVEILVNGDYPSIKAIVNNGAFTAQVFLSFSTNTIIVLARNQLGQVATAAITVFSSGEVTDPPDVQVSVQWDKFNDLDLYLVTPAGNLIWFGNTNADGGSLNIDRINESHTGPEVISFPPGQAPNGTYGVAVQFFNERDLGPATATVSILVKGRLVGSFNRLMTTSDASPFSSAVTLADVNPASVWNVAAFDFPAATLATERPLNAFVLRPGAAEKTGPVLTARKGKLPARAFTNASLPATRLSSWSVPPARLTAAPRLARAWQQRFTHPAPFVYANLRRVDETEPNNTPEQAQTLTGATPLTLTGNAETSDEGGISINFTDGSSDDLEDLYRITTVQDGLRLTLDGFTSDCDVYLLNAEISEVVASSNFIGAAEPEEIDDPALPAGTYLIGISIFDADPGGGPTTAYTLTVEGDLGGGTPPPGDLQAYRLYRSTTPNARNTGALIGEVGAALLTFSDTNLSSGTYFYQATALYGTVESPPSNEISATVTGGTTDREATDELPQRLELIQNYPNPFNPTTTIQYGLPAPTRVTVAVYNVLGERIATLVDQAQQPAGYYSVVWNGRTVAGNTVASGLYMYQLQAGEQNLSRTMLLMK